MVVRDASGRVEAGKLTDHPSVHDHSPHSYLCLDCATLITITRSGRTLISCRHLGPVVRRAARAPCPSRFTHTPSDCLCGSCVARTHLLNSARHLIPHTILPWEPERAS